MFHHLALLTSRVYIYKPFVWRPRGHQSFVPLSAFLTGVTRNSVNDAIFAEVCSPQETKYVQLQIPNHNDRWEEANRVLNGKEKCIVVTDWIFDWGYATFIHFHEDEPDHSIVSSLLQPSIQYGPPSRTICTKISSGLPKSAR